MRRRAEANSRKDKGDGGILGSGIGPDVGPDLATPAKDLGEAVLQLRPETRGASVGADLGKGKDIKDVSRFSPVSPPGEAIGKISQSVEKGGNPVYDAWNSTFGQAINPAVRGYMTAQQAPQQLVMGDIRARAQDVSEHGLGAFNPLEQGQRDYERIKKEGLSPETIPGGVGPSIAQTTAYQAGKRMAEGKEAGLGEGLLPNPEEPAGQAQAAAARKYSPYLIGGHAWSPGRALAGLGVNAGLIEEDDKAFNAISGMTDAASTVATDPLLVVGPAAKEARAGARGVGTASRAEAVEAALNSRHGKGIVADLADHTNAELIKDKYPTLERPTAERLAATRNPDRVRSILKGELEVGKEIVPGTTKIEPVASGLEAPAAANVPESARTTPNLGVNPPEPEIGSLKISPGEQRGILEKAGLHYGLRKYANPNSALEWLASKDFAPVRDRAMEIGKTNPATAAGEMRELLGSNFSKDPSDFHRLAEAAATGDPVKFDNAIHPLIGIAQKEPRFGVGYGWRRKTSDVRLLNATPNGMYDRADPHEFIQQLDRDLINQKTPHDERMQILSDAMRGTSRESVGRGAAYGALDAVGKAGQRMLTSYGMGEEEAKGLMTFFRKTEEDHRNYLTNQTADGAPVNMGADGIILADEGVPIDFEKNPFRVNHLMNEKIGGLDYREIRRNTSAFKPFFANGLVQKGTALADAYMSAWKMSKIYRPALGVRVIMDEQARMAASGLDSTFRHPMRAIAWQLANPNERLGPMLDRLTPSGVTPSEGVRGLKGVAAKLGAGPKRSEAAEGPPAPGAEGAAAGGVTGGKTPTGVGGSDIYQRPWSVSDEEFGKSLNRFRDLHGTRKTEFYRNYFDSVPRQHEQAARGLVEDLSLATDSLNQRVIRNGVDDAAEWFWSSPEGSRLRMDMAQDHGFAPLAHDRNWSDVYVKTQDAANRMITGGDQELIDAMGSGQLRGHTLVDPDTGMHANPKAIKEVQKIFDEGRGPDRVRVQDEVTWSPQKHKANMAAIRNGVDWLFAELMPKPSDYLSRSPTFRQTYWKEVERLLPNVDPAERKLVLDGAQYANLDRKWIGRSDFERIQGQANKNLGITAEDGRMMSAKQLDQAAKGLALDETKNLLWDLSERGQFMDVNRLIFPFGEAWKEVVSRWTKLAWEDPTILRKAQLGIEGARDAGLFYKDDQLGGQEVFGIPGTEWANEQISGIPVPFGAPVSGLNIATTGTPGIGPLAQLTASQLMRDKPEYDHFRDILYPFGEPEKTGDPLYDTLNILDPLPTFTRRLRAAFSSADTSREYAGTTGWAMRFLKSDDPGKYPNTPEGQQKLLADAKEAATRIILFRGLVQTTSPSAPYPQWKVKDKGGKLVDGRKLYDEWNKMISNGKLDYDEAYGKFIKKHGKGNMLMTQAFSEAVKGYAPYTDSADKWIRSNSDLRGKYPNTYGLFAPADGEFSIDAWQNQLQYGDRKELSPDEILRRANDRHARYIYNRESEGVAHDEEGRKYLHSLKDWLVETYNGYRPDDFENQTPDTIRELGKAVKDPQVRKAAPEMSSAIREYMTERQSMIDESEGGNLAGKDDEERRKYLWDYGQYLSKRHRGFARVFQSVFDGEVRNASSSVTNTDNKYL